MRGRSTITLVGAFVGAALWAVASHTNSHHYAAKGRMAALVSAGSALVIGAAPGLVNFFAHLGSDGQVSLAPSGAGRRARPVAARITRAANTRRRVSALGERSLHGCSTAPRRRCWQVASTIGATTAPNLDSTWFSSTYWRVAALAAMLTVPFLCAAAVQALARSDLALLARSVFGYLPLSLIGVSLAAPLTMLLLAATDQMSAAVSATGRSTEVPAFSIRRRTPPTTWPAIGGGPFFAVIIGLFAMMAALALAVELLVRAAAVYVVVLMLPLAFAAMVWPARRMWATRLVELLVSLILARSS